MGPEIALPVSSQVVLMWLIQDRLGVARKLYNISIFLNYTFYF